MKKIINYKNKKENNVRVVGLDINLPLWSLIPVIGLIIYMIWGR